MRIIYICVNLPSQSKGYSYYRVLVPEVRMCNQFCTLHPLKVASTSTVLASMQLLLTCSQERSNFLHPIKKHKDEILYQVSDASTNQAGNLIQGGISTAL